MDRGRGRISMLACLTDAPLFDLILIQMVHHHNPSFCHNRQIIDGQGLPALQHARPFLPTERLSMFECAPVVCTPQFNIPRPRNPKVFTSKLSGKTRYSHRGLAHPLIHLLADGMNFTSHRLTGPCWSCVSRLVNQSAASLPRD